MDLMTTIVGTVAAVGTTAAWLPQVIRTLRSGSARDFSWYYLGLFLAGVALWIVYGALRRDWVVFTANVITLMLVLTVAGVKMRER